MNPGRLPLCQCSLCGVVAIAAAAPVSVAPLVVGASAAAAPLAAAAAAAAVASPVAAAAAPPEIGCKNLVKGGPRKDNMLL